MWCRGISGWSESSTGRGGGTVGGNGIGSWVGGGGGGGGGRAGGLDVRFGLLLGAGCDGAAGARWRMRRAVCCFCLRVTPP